LEQGWLTQKLRWPPLCAAGARCVISNWDFPGSLCASCFSFHTVRDFTSLQECYVGKVVAGLGMTSLRGMAFWVVHDASIRMLIQNCAVEVSFRCYAMQQDLISPDEPVYTQVGRGGGSRATRTLNATRIKSSPVT